MDNMLPLKTFDDPPTFGYCGEQYNYNDILDTFPCHIAIQVDDDDYQGDTRILFHDCSKYGYLCFGWGSCSGCDALQACQTFAEVQDLQKRLFDSIIWFDNAQEALQWVLDRDWETKFEFHANETKAFVEMAKIYLALRAKGIVLKASGATVDQLTRL